MRDIEWINQDGYCDGPHPEKHDGTWRYPKGRTAIRKFIKVNGIVNYELVCTTTGCKFKSTPIPSAAARNLIARLPTLADRNAETRGHVCCYYGCESTRVEWHHFAPRNTFGQEAHNYPIQPLCREHHQHWHRTMDGYRWQDKSDNRQTPPSRDLEEIVIELLANELGARPLT